MEGPLAEIDVFKPHRIEGFVEAPQSFPHVTPSHEKRAGGLFHGTRTIEIAIQIAVAAIHRIERPQAIDAEKLKDESGGRGQSADGERTFGTPDEFSGREAILLARMDERVNPSEQIRVWIQKQEEIRVGRSDALIHGGGESAIFEIRNDLHLLAQGAALCHSDGLVARGVVDDNSGQVGSHVSEGVEARPDDGFRVERYDDRGSSQK
jgi:hypothetical protein